MPNNNVVEIVVKLNDQFTTALKAAEAQTRRSTEVMSSSFASLGKTFAAVSGAFAGATFLHKFVEESATAEDAAVRLDKVYAAFGARAGASRQNLDDFAKSIQDTTAFSDESVQKMQAVFLRFGNVTGTTFIRARQAAVDLAAALGTDLESAAFSLGRALESPADGMRALRAAGIVLTDQEKALLKQFEATGEIAKAQDVILRKLETTYRGTADALGNTFNGQLAKFKNAVGDLFEQPGSLPQLTAALKELTDLAKSPEAKEGFDGFASAATEAFNAVFAAARVVLVPMSKLIQQASDLGSIIDNKLFGRPFTEGFMNRRYGNPALGGGGPATRSPHVFPEDPANTGPSAEAIKAAQKATEDWAKAWREAQDKVNEYGKSVQEVVSMNTTGTEEFQAALKSMDEQMDAIREKRARDKDALYKDNEDVRDLSNFAKQASETIQSSFADAFMNIGHGVKGMVRGFLEAFKQILANAAAFDLAKALKLDKIFSGGSGGSALGAVFGGIKSIFGFAGGGTAGGLTRVGEDGPETVWLPSGSRVFNSRQLAFAGAMGGAAFAPQNNVTIYATKDTDVEALRSELIQTIFYVNQKSFAEYTRTLERNGLGRIR